MKNMYIIAIMVITLVGIIELHVEEIQKRETIRFITDNWGQ